MIGMAEPYLTSVDSIARRGFGEYLRVRSMWHVHVVELSFSSTSSSQAAGFDICWFTQDPGMAKGYFKACVQGWQKRIFSSQGHSLDGKITVIVVTFIIL